MLFRPVVSAEQFGNTTSTIIPNTFNAREEAQTNLFKEVSHAAEKSTVILGFDVEGILITLLVLCI